MARIRTIKPEAFHSDTLSRLTVESERTFFGLLTQADDEGRLKDAAAVLNGALWPLRPEHAIGDMETDLSALSAVGLLCRYEVSGRKYMHLTTFGDHQKINRKTASKLPSCVRCEGASARVGTGTGDLFEGADPSGQRVPQHQKSVVGVSVDERGAAAQEATPSEVASLHGGLSEPSLSPQTAPSEGSAPSASPAVALDRPDQVRSTASGPAVTASPQVNGASPEEAECCDEVGVSAHGGLTEHSLQERKGKDLERKGTPLSRRASLPSRDRSSPGQVLAASPQPGPDVDQVTESQGSSPGQVEQDSPAPQGVDATDEVTVVEAIVEAAVDTGTGGAAPEQDSDEEGDAVKAVDENQVELFEVAAPEPKQVQTKKKRAAPKSWTAERKEVAHAILRPWWDQHGTGWGQGYGVVFGVLVAALANGVSAEDLTAALGVLGPERKPISGGTIQFALSRRSRSEEVVIAEQAARRDPANYSTTW